MLAHATRPVGDDEDHAGFVSSSVRVASSPDRGRHLVAARDIEPGELIAEDRPVIRVLKKEFTKSHCWHCLKRVERTFPCGRCTEVIFCSEKCFSVSMQVGHR